MVKAKAEKIEKAIKAEKKEKDGEKIVKEKKEGVKKESVKKEKDGKEKVKAVTGEEAETLILRYLREQNRPYSATEVSANLHGKVSFSFLLISCQDMELGRSCADECGQVTKTVADKLLKEMEQSGTIMGKASNGEKKPGEKKGGQWVFWCLQVRHSSHEISTSS